jgi:hypothetical protein
MDRALEAAVNRHLAAENSTAWRRLWRRFKHRLESRCAGVVALDREFGRDSSHSPRAFA